jgi:hypothetical protein
MQLSTYTRVFDGKVYRNRVHALPRSRNWRKEEKEASVVWLDNRIGSNQVTGHLNSSPYPFLINKAY